MHRLHMNDCDNYPSTINTWKKKPSEKSILAYLEDYHDIDECKKILSDLLSWGIADVNNSQCTVYYLDEE